MQAPLRARAGARMHAGLPSRSVRRVNGREEGPGACDLWPCGHGSPLSFSAYAELLGTINRANIVRQFFKSSSLLAYSLILIDIAFTPNARLTYKYIFSITVNL